MSDHGQEDRCPRCEKGWCCHVGDGHDEPLCPREGNDADLCRAHLLAEIALLRSRAMPPEVEAAAEDVVRGDWWGHYCPSCGSTYKHGPECRIGRLAKALSSARGAKGGE